MKTIDSGATKNIQVNLGIKVMNILYFIHDNVLDYPIIEDEPMDTSKLRRRTKEDKESYRIFSLH